MKLVVFTFHRYEPDWLIEGWLENIWWVRTDGIGEIIHADSSAHSGPWMPKAERKEAMTRMARDAGGDYILELDADERLEGNARQVIPRLLGAIEDKDTWPHFRFPLREMWTPTEYRVDGRWGGKRRGRLRPLRKGNGEGINTEVNIYHLSHIEAESRQARRDTHQRWNRWDGRSGSYDYILNERGLRLEKIPEGREFSPPYIKPYVRKAVT